MDKETVGRFERLFGFRIATELLLKDVLVQVYRNDPAELERVKEWNARILIGMEWPADSHIDGENVRHYALSSLQAVVSEAIDQIRGR